MLKSINIKNGLGKITASQKAECIALPQVVGMFFPTCREVYSNMAADVYEYAQYGGNVSSIPVYKPSATDTPQDIAKKQTQLIEDYAATTGYHPEYAEHLTADEIVTSAKDSLNYLPYLIGGFAVVAVLVFMKK
jgi:hypothetical protein